MTAATVADVAAASTPQGLSLLQLRSVEPAAEEAPAETPSDPTSGEQTPPAEGAAPQPEGGETPTDESATQTEEPPADAPAEEGAAAPAEGEAPRDASSAEAGQAMSGQADVRAEGDVTDIGKKKKKKDLSHWKLGSVSVAGGWGFYMVIPYTDDQFCGEYSTEADSNSQHKSLCTQGNPWYLDFQAGYGAIKRMDVVLNFRLNLQPREFRCEEGSDTASCKGKGLYNQKLGIALGPGIRAWISKPQQLFKVGAAIDLLWVRENFEGYRNRTECTGPPQCAAEPEEADDAVTDAEQGMGDNDFGIRLGPTFQIDPHHNVGIFLSPYARMSFIRWFEMTFDISLGVQARFP